MSRAVLVLPSFAAAILLAAAPAAAQYQGYRVADPATGERYHVEARVGLWNPTPEIQVQSESLGIPGDRIDAVADLGFAKDAFTDFHLVLRPARKHKFLFDYVPIKYSVETVLQRSFVFNGQLYEIGLPVNALLDWKAYRFGYEYDFVYRDRGFAGFVLGVEYTDALVELNAPLISEFARAKAPVPTLGGIVRLYPAANISVTAEITGIKVPESIDERYKGRWFNFNLYGTVNFTDHVGAQVGYRSMDVTYTVKDDSGSFLLKGLYIAGVARF